MNITAQDQKNNHINRQKIKTQDNRLITEVTQGTGISGWEAEVLVDVVKSVYFNDPNDRSKLRSGQMPYECVLATENHGKPLKDCKKCTAVLTIHERDDIQLGLCEGQNRLREIRIQRLTEEAREQGGLLTQEDLAILLCCDVRTIRRAIKNIKNKYGIHVATRGYQKDIGPSVSHKGIAIKNWLLGKEPNEVALLINHSLKAVERYIQHFCRVLFLRGQRFQTLEIAFTLGISTETVNSYLDIYHAYKKKKGCQFRWDEIEIIGKKYYEAKDFEKGGAMEKMQLNKGGKKQ
jgi:DNA-binding CsgD family transcriptional regulator